VQVVPVEIGKPFRITQNSRRKGPPRLMPRQAPITRNDCEPSVRLRLGQGGVDAAQSGACVYRCDGCGSVDAGHGASSLQCATASPGQEVLTSGRGAYHGLIRMRQRTTSTAATVQVSCDDLGRPLSPGDYPCQGYPGYMVPVRDVHIAYWQKYPNATLSATASSSLEKGPILVLTEPPNDAG
jgi:hypothetical protein